LQLKRRAGMQLGPELNQRGRHLMTKPPPPMYAYVTPDAQRNERAFFTVSGAMMNQEP
jgi:hypothetical protein